MARKQASATDATATTTTTSTTTTTATESSVPRKQGAADAPVPLALVLYARLAKTVRFLDSVRGTDKVLMFVQYFSKVLIHLLTRNSRPSRAAASLANLAAPVSDFRILLRYYGMLPLLQWTVASEQSPSPSPRIQTLVRLQNVANFLYYPLEHVYWLGLHKVIDISEEKINRIGIWSCRFWAAYVVLYFGQLWEEYKALRLREKALLVTSRNNHIAVEKENSSASSTAAKAQRGLGGISDDMPNLLDQEIQILRTAKWNLLVNAIINTAYFPLTVHWSLERSSFPDIGVGICGTIAAIAQLYTSWRAM